MTSNKMGLLECASGASVWRGYDYYKGKKVLTLEKIAEDMYKAKVSGNAKEPYSVELHIVHPRKSKCNCPHADGKRIICKHIVAAYFTVLPEEAERFYAEVLAYQEEEEKREEKLFDEVCRCVEHMQKSELQDALLQCLFEGPEWQFFRFIQENGLDERW